MRKELNIMPKFLIEVPHDSKTEECARAVQYFLTFGSYFMTHTDWGCLDGEHKGWITVEANSREEARNMIPPNFRSQAKIVQLNRFTMEEMENILRHHK
jgi:hypothetical protein